jgi:16S rRNA processing protein RimM
MGRIVAPYGVRGWVKIEPYTDAVDGLFAYKTWWISRDGNWQAYRLTDGRTHGRHLVVRLGEVPDRDAATSIKGWKVAVPRSELPPVPAGEYYWADLIGLAVVNMDGEPLGVVEEIFSTGANDVMVVRAERERLIPFVENVIARVELSDARIVVDWRLDY